MRGLVIVNPNAGSSVQLAALEQAITEAGLQIHHSEEPGDALIAARDAADKGFELVIAAGGDGTVTEVVDGIAVAGFRVCLGVLPLGTGNDLARTLAIPMEPGAALSTLLEYNERNMDLIRVQVDGGTVSLAANVAAGGFSGQVGEELTAEAKERWGKLAYIFSAAKVLPGRLEYKTTIAWDDGQAEEIDALAVLVANGRSLAGGHIVAPLASIEDGLVDVVILRGASLLDLAGVAARLALGNFLESDAVTHRRARALRVESTPPMRFNVDGELLPEGAVTFRVLPGVLRVLVGPDYAPRETAAEQEAAAGALRGEL